MARGRNTPPGPLTFAIAAILRDALLESLMTQTQLGDRIGMPQSMVSTYLNAGKVLDVELLDQMCRALGLELGNVIRVAVDAKER